MPGPAFGGLEIRGRNTSVVGGYPCASAGAEACRKLQSLQARRNGDKAIIATVYLPTITTITIPGRITGRSTAPSSPNNKANTSHHSLRLRRLSRLDLGTCVTRRTNINFNTRETHPAARHPSRYCAYKAIWPWASHCLPWRYDTGRWLRWLQ